jgi:pyruvate dehydrogenase phosphatase
MHRAALQAFRLARRPLHKRITQTREFLFGPSDHAFNFRSLTYSRNRTFPHLLTSSMHFGRVSAALVSTLVASGAWYAYRGTQTSSDTVPANLGRNTASGPQDSPVASLESGAAEASDRPRQALVVDKGDVYASEIPGNAPLSKETDDYGRKILEMMTPEQATQKLRRNEESWLVGRGKGVVRYDVVQLPSNDPIEDDHAERTIEVPSSVTVPAEGSSNSDWMFWGVFDGHRYMCPVGELALANGCFSGWTTSAKLRQALIAFVVRELNTTYKSALADPSSPIPSPELVDAAIKKGFLRLDNEIVHESVKKVTKGQSKRLAAELLAPALSGSCALLSFYDSKSKLLRVACTGDSRAVLGRRGANGKWSATALSVDQTGGNEAEAARLRREHPGEEHVTLNGRILGGLEPSRAFGDAIYKWSVATQERIKKDFFGRSSSHLIRTPPYVTAEPVITTTKVEPQKGDFVVMATDGLWEMLTNEEVVGLVGRWLEDQVSNVSVNAQKRSGSSSWLSGWFRNQNALPVDKSDGAAASPDEASQRAPIRQRQWGIKTDLNQRFVVEDKNAATHLIRNALGGRDRDQVCALLTLPSPYSRRYR